MKTARRRNGFARRRKGAMLVLIAILLIGFMATVAFSVDIALMHLTRTELRTATDAASKAAAIELSQSLDRNQAIARGQEIAALNDVSGDPLLLAAGDFEFGRSAEQPNGKFTFTNIGTPTNSVRVAGRRTNGSLSGPVPLMFGNVLGVDFFESTANSTATYIERDIVLVVDRSGSMAGPKFAGLVSAIDVFVDTLDQTGVEEFVGVASYSQTATEDVQLTRNLAEVSSSVATMPIGGFTSISRGMLAGRNIMNRSRGADFVERTMIVMTDGRHNRGREPRTVATQLAADRVTVHTITFGSNADITRMREVADIGNGQHFHAQTAQQLREIYREIALTLNTIITE